MNQLPLAQIGQSILSVSRSDIQVAIDHLVALHLRHAIEISLKFEVEQVFKQEAITHARMWWEQLLELL